MNRVCKHGHELTEENIYIRPDGYTECKFCRTLKVKNYFKDYPWYSHYNSSHTRCLTSTQEKHKHYRKREFELTVQEVKNLWLRDKAYEMSKPSIDRIDNDKGYTLNNCRFIEAYENNSRVDRKGIKNSFAKLTEQQVIEIRTLFDLGNISKTKLANKFNVTVQAICLIIKRINWSHI